jgi:hypothetical protein
MLNFQDPQVWWFLTRASAMVGWVLLTLTVVWGVLLKTRILRGADNPEWLTVTHRYISGLALAMILTHMGTLLLDEYISFGWADIWFLSPPALNLSLLLWEYLRFGPSSWSKSPLSRRSGYPMLCGKGFTF